MNNLPNAHRQLWNCCDALASQYARQDVANVFVKGQAAQKYAYVLTVTMKIIPELRTHMVTTWIEVLTAFVLSDLCINLNTVSHITIVTSLAL